MGSIPGSESDEKRRALEASPDSSAYEEITRFLRSRSAGETLAVQGAGRSAWAFALAGAIRQGGIGPLLLITEGQREAQGLERDLAFFCQGESRVRILRFPAVDVAPYVSASPPLAAIGERLEVLYQLATVDQRPPETLVVVSPARALFERVIAKSTLLRSILRVSCGDSLDRDALTEHFLENGYLKSSTVEEHGTFAVRGHIVDCYPPLMNHPVRLEFYGDEVETIRYFSAESQRALPVREGQALEQVLILPAREGCLTDQSVPRIQMLLKKRMDDADIPKGERDRISQMVGARVYFPGIEHYLPLFHDKTDSFFDYWPSGQTTAVLCQAGSVSSRMQKVREAIQEAAESTKREFHPLSIIQPEERFALDLPDWPTVEFDSLEIKKRSGVRTVPLLAKSQEELRHEMANARAGVGEPLTPLLTALDRYKDRAWRTFLVSERPLQAKRFAELLHHRGVPVQVWGEGDHSKLSAFFDGPEVAGVDPKTVVLLQGSLSAGFVAPGKALAVITEEDLFGPRVHRKRNESPATPAAKANQQSNSVSRMITAFSELSPGDYVVHLDFGVARYQGLEKLRITGADNEFLVLEYKDSDRLYLPVHRVSRIQKYVGGEAEEIGLDRLGNPGAWERTQEKVKRRIQEVAQDLVKLYAARQISRGHAFGKPNDFYREFEAEFPFEETPDQSAAIADVLSDLQSDKPTDRLICGDVGFGKTEVAIRGIFMVSMEGYQSALLAPTTVLVHQHMQTLRKRFEGYPIRIGMLSRFSTPAETKETLKGLSDGTIDVVVGTHRLLSSDVQFKKLGLLVVDEEQRFGVKHKERIKLLKKNVDVLTLSATPIPRTLNMSMIGIRDLSVINTPPTDRVSIRTIVSEFDDRTIREAILHEVQRGGQAYFVHNRVQNIDAMADYLKRLVPEARFAVAHGQMPEGELEKVMVAFVDQKADVLLCTSIIESGLDIPLVNTILINRADRFGLSQLYQIRGRVGRSNRRAYAYLLIPGNELLSETARKRLEVLQRYTELGSGFKIASYDLEIRGAGNLLGREQAGQVRAVGLELYVTLMNRALRELKGEKVEDVLDPEIELRIPAFIPDAYIPDDHLRLATYKRLSMLDQEEELEEMELELRDRFGALPREVHNLLGVITIKILARRTGIKKVSVSGSSTVLSFQEEAPVDVRRLLHLVNTHKGWRLLPDNQLQVQAVSSADGTIPIDREKRVLEESLRLLRKIIEP